MASSSTNWKPVSRRGPFDLGRGVTMKRTFTSRVRHEYNVNNPGKETVKVSLYAPQSDPNYYGLHKLDRLMVDVTTKPRGREGFSYHSPSSLGVRVIKQAIQKFKQLYPHTHTMFGDRVTGAKSGFLGVARVTLNK